MLSFRLLRGKSNIPLIDWKHKTLNCILFLSTTRSPSPTIVTMKVSSSSSTCAFATPNLIQELPKVSIRAPFSTEVDPVTGMLTVHSCIPKGIGIETGPLGKKVIAKEHFSAGEFIYRGYAALLDLSLYNHKYNVRLYDHEGSFLTEYCNDSVHSVVDYDAHVQEMRDSSVQSWADETPKIRQVYGFDAYMNHSCDANAYFPLVTRNPGLMSYDAIAIHDIFAGDEITCDYATFDYECNGHEIETCYCGAHNCRGQMLGFRSLGLEEQVSIMHLCEPEILETFFKERPDIVLLRTTVPQGLEVVMRKGDNHLIATRTFEAGEEIFTNTAILFPPEDCRMKKFILECNGKYTMLDFMNHFIHRDNYVEAVGFDSFMDHSCEPNTKQTYKDSVTYTVVADRDIVPGERITCDYDTLDCIASAKFECNCGASKCRGFIEC